MIPTTRKDGYEAYHTSTVLETPSGVLQLSAQNKLITVFGGRDLVALERLVAEAQTRDPSVIEAAARLEVGEVTLSEQIRARSSVGDAAMALLEANAEVIEALEALSAVVGINPAETRELLTQE